MQGQTIGALAERSHDPNEAAAVMLKEKIPRCDRRLARYQRSWTRAQIRVKAGLKPTYRP